ncbi:MAG TPA: class I SAM-dependent methyltransferase [Chitinophaga sp.]|uniref:class I SAM-dependent methyltransferase n=1 Tax=Chitinophaga sp. TaxID=1869181 RepID=UPI002BA9A559|nr:class I SAM-dependent methyltransferase [Chitinophaga sp.]HVI44228.1 class I SAM-dependent methyltransferase [Chitinophaga sp.]
MNSTTRFTDRADNYARYRPGYPAEALAYLKEQVHLHSDMIVADIGSGTGISSALFLENGHTVYGIEPNDAMRAKSITLLNHYPNFHGIKGTAENTGLKDSSIDIIFAAQSFHWFSQQEAKAEFRRIATPDAWILLMWNIRELSSPFAQAYESLLKKYGTGYQEAARDMASEDKNTAFFSPCKFEKVTFPSIHRLDYEELKGRLLSISFVPAEQDPCSQPMLHELTEIFNHYEENGQVNFGYTTTLYAARAHC